MVALHTFHLYVSSKTRSHFNTYSKVMPSFFIRLLIVLSIYQGANIGVSTLHIDGPTERKIQAGSSFLLSCHGNGTVAWRHPQSEESQFSYASKKTPSGHTSILTVESPDYLATGFYECFDEDEESRVYVYVFDEDHLLAVHPHDIFLYGQQYENIVVPCKPTSPDVNVILSFHDEIVKFDRYDPKVGFTIPNVTLLDSGSISCIGIRNGQEDREDFILRVDLTKVPHKTIRLVINPSRVSYKGPLGHCKLSYSETVPQPEINEESIQRVVVGQDVTLECTIDVELSLPFALDWMLPASVNLNGRYAIGKTERHRNSEDSDTTRGVTTLTLSRVVKADEGNYTCRVRVHNKTNSDTKYLKIYSEYDSFINISVQSKSIEVDATTGEMARWVITINAHPNFELNWYDPEGNEIPRSMAVSNKYQIRERNAQTILEIMHVELEDAGNYTLIASNSGGREVLELELIVLDKPEVSFHFSGFYRIHVPANVSCLVKGYPTPSIYWRFRKCYSPSHCLQFETISGKSKMISELQISESHIVSTIEWPMEEPGELTCIALNEKGTDEDVLPVLVTDVPEGFLIGKTPGDIVEGDSLTLACAVTSYEYQTYPEWLFKKEGSTQTVVNKSVVVEDSRDYSYWSRIIIKNVTVSHSGNFTCKAQRITDFTSTEKSVPIHVLKAKPPRISDTNLPNDAMTISSWQPITWKCNVTGVPEPSILWYKNDEILNVDEEFSNYELLDRNRTLSIKSLTTDEEGKYKCKATNKIGEVEAFVYLKLQENHKTNTTLIISVVVVAAFFVVVLFLFFYALWKLAKDRKELRLAGLENFKEGMTKSINQDLTLDQQTDLLPYDPKWEFPSSKLKLGKQLGAGAFGVVLKAEAFGIVEVDEWTTVAVKMVKRHADPAYIRALVSELKILGHLGKHLNVVNLLGACTKNYMKRELLVIVEFCKYGNAHNYLLSHRHRFIDQIDKSTGEIDVTKRSAVDNYNRIGINYATLTFPRSVDSDPNSALASFDTEVTCLSSERSVGEENSLNTRNNPDWCANLQGDYKRYDADELSTSTLICWSFQVARGMEYLASRRVLHGDLAARNVLIADNNIVKICDFGFAKNIYSHPEYQKTGDGPVPVKWMAIESITRRIFSTQSDVWSFGIVLWEFFSLARTPYPGFENYESILNKLESGYRMEMPLYANQALYDIMLECWDQQPCRRPSFSELVMKLGKLLESYVREHYIQLNEPFRQQIIPAEEDYLSMMSPPTYDPPASHYVNEPSKQGQNEDADGYLKMRSSWNPVIPKDGGAEDSIEMKPMLTDQEKTVENEDYLIPRQVPANSDCAFNPSYRIFNSS